MAPQAQNISRPIPEIRRHRQTKPKTPLRHTKEEGILIRLTAVQANDRNARTDLAGSRTPTSSPALRFATHHKRQPQGRDRSHTSIPSNTITTAHTIHQLPPFNGTISCYSIVHSRKAVRFRSFSSEKVNRSRPHGNLADNFWVRELRRQRTEHRPPHRSSKFQPPKPSSMSKCSATLHLGAG